MPLTAADVVAHWPDDPAATGLVRLPGWEAWASPKVVCDHDPGWAAQFDELAVVVRLALGDRVIDLHHVGSTAVPGLVAKPVLDVDLVVADPAAEEWYAPALQSAGFHFHAREPGWHEHRLFKRREPFTHLHVFGPECPEVVRHVLFRDWLVTHPADRDRYAAAKRRAVEAHSADLPYTRGKEPVVRAIYERLFRAHGFLGP